MNQLTEKEMEIVRILRKESGPLNPMSGNALARRLKIRNAAPYVYSLRLKKFPICSKGRGYFYASEDAHLDECIKLIERKASVIARQLEGLKGAYFNVHSFDRAFGGGKSYVDLPVRVGDAVIYERFEIGGDGKPVIPAGVNVI